MGEAGRRVSDRTKLTVLLAAGILAVGSAITGATQASASSGIDVFVSYADSLRAEATSFPTPWFASPSTIFEGCLPSACSYDAGAVRIVNNTNSTVTANVVAVRLESCTFSGWYPVALTAGSELIVTELPTGTATGCPNTSHMDTSDVGKNGQLASGCANDGIQPQVDVEINGQTTTYTDSGQVLNTGGADAAVCGFPNESIQWTPIGNPPCRGSLFNLAPTSQTHAIGSTATVIATFTNGCGQPLSNVLVSFTVQSGPNAGPLGTATTDASGQASFSYTSATAGTDTINASITNPVGTFSSNSVTVIWIAFAPGGGTFVIGDMEDHTGAAVYWWGAQWWKNDPLSTGLAPAAFKGYENSVPAPRCGDAWTTRPGNSSKPPQVVPANTQMAVIVSSTITKRGSTISGNVVDIVIVQTNPGYGPNPGHPGTGTIIGSLCSTTPHIGAQGWVTSAAGAVTESGAQSIRTVIESPTSLPRLPGASARLGKIRGPKS